MNILREIALKPQDTLLDDNFVVIGDKKIDKNTEIEVGKQLKKKYTVEQLAFFLLNKEMMYTQYLRKCKENNIGPIFYTDQKILCEELEQSREEVAPYSFDPIDSLYTSKNDYSWVCEFFSGESKHKKDRKTCVEPYRIIVPSSIASFVNLSNIEKFLRTGQLQKTNSLVLDKIELFLNDKRFIVEDTITDWTLEDWKSLVRIFLDGSSWQLNEWKIEDFASLFSKIPSFYLFEDGKVKSSALDGYNVKRIGFKDGKCGDNDFQDILNQIFKVCDSLDNGL